jgi:hypothetical protein
MSDQEDNTSELTVGQWLGTHNRITSLVQYAYGWKATDSTDATYRQDFMPDGLKVADVAMDCTNQPITPWPKEKTT